jgi:predicted hydrolase (HD superfamily)
MATPDRDQALQLLKEYTKSESLLNHARAVEAVMRHFAARYGEDVEKWGVIGLVHDLDWEMFPDEHCTRTTEILTAAAGPMITSAPCAATPGACSPTTSPNTPWEKVLYTIDELTGLITATALVRPSRSILDMKVKSVTKKWKEKSFAAGANREVIAAGAEMMGMPLNEVIQETLAGMQTVAADIGLAGGE